VPLTVELVAPQTNPQAPAEQAGTMNGVLVAAQAFPQTLQLFASVCVFAQPPAQQTLPVVHAWFGLFWPFVSVPHVPPEPQTLHVPVQALLQQTPSAQKPDEHWSVAAQVAPRPCLAWHAPAPTPSQK